MPMAETMDPLWTNRIGRRLKLRDLHILATVVHCGSMAKAATQLAMSQPAVSEAMANLEDTLHVRLLDRSSKGIEPTIFAETLLKRGRTVFDEIRQAIGELEHLADPAAGEVRLACGDTIAAGLLPEVIDRLARAHPRLSVHVIQASADTLDFRELRERRVDLALVRLEKSFEHEDLEVTALFDDRHRVVASARSPWALRRKLSLAELVDEPWAFPSGPVISRFIAEAFEARGLEMPRARVSASSVLLRNQLLASGGFLTILPDSVLAYHAKPWLLKALPIDLGVAPRPVMLVTLKHRTVSPVVGRFIEEVRSLAKRHVG
jgi:DNA-binding transcriptional LysR family regulator